MDVRGMEKGNFRARSFRFEDSTNRRVFLRSYPLNWRGDDEEERKEATLGVGVTKGGDGKKPIKKMILSVIHWGEGRVVVFRRFKNKVTLYVIACLPVGFKPPTGLISA